MKRRWSSLAILMLTPAFTQAQQPKQGPTRVEVKLSARGAEPDPARVERLDTVVWSGKEWRIRFARKFWFFKHTPCKGKKEEFRFDEAEDQRTCVVEVECKKAGGCRYKYNSKAEGGPWIDPEIEVEPTRSNR